MLSAIAAGKAAELPVVIKTDVHGSLEAIRVALENLGTDQVQVKTLSSGVGALSLTDISLATASNAIVIGFNVGRSRKHVILPNGMALKFATTQSFTN